MACFGLGLAAAMIFAIVAIGNEPKELDVKAADQTERLLATSDSRSVGMQK